jgi:uncharacterized protein
MVSFVSWWVSHGYRPSAQRKLIGPSAAISAAVSSTRYRSRLWGFPSYNHDFMVTYSLLAANQVMSLIFDGVFDRFPTLRIVLVEHAFSWILPLMWRMDAIYEARKSWLDIKRKPSEYVKDHIKFTTQPLDYPEDKTQLTRALEWMEADKILLYSSDYPHWTYDDPRWLVKHLPEHAREAIMFRNGIETYKLPETVPALDGQVRAF